MADTGSLIELSDDFDAEDDDGVTPVPGEGGSYVDMEEPVSQTPAVDEDPDHWANLAETLPDTELGGLATDLLRLVAMDKESRSEHDKKYAEGLRRTGLGDDAPGGAQFDGASKVVHPMLVEAGIDFASRAMKEAFPANGPAKSLIPGTVSRERIDKGERKAKHLNWQLTKQMPGFREELEQTITQVPVSGVQYMGGQWDSRHRRPDIMFVPVDDVYLPYSASGFYSARRRTWVEHLTDQAYQGRITSGVYRKVDIIPASQPPELTDPEKANEKIEGKGQPSENPDGMRDVYRIDLDADFEGGSARGALAVGLRRDTEDKGPSDRLYPYVVHVDPISRAVLGIYRNWLPEDKTETRLDWLVEFPFVPWRGAYPIGLTHMIGGLSGAATGALRCLLDAGLISTLQGALKLKGGGKGGANITIQPTQVTEIEGSIVQDDIRKLMMPIPFNPPSTVLFQLLGFLVDAGKGVVRTTYEDLPDTAGANMPVGTTLALIEQGMTVFSAIHARLHNAMAKLLDMLCLLNSLYQDDDELKDEIGEILAYRADYDGPMDVQPVSDPNIFSETQRFAQVQAVVARSDAHPELYDQRAVETLLLQRLKIPEFEKLLKKAPEPKKLNAVNENLAAAQQQPLTAFPDQDHLAHLQTHLDFIASPFLGSSPLLAPSCLGNLLNHLREHIALWYVNGVYELSKELLEEDPSEYMKTDELTPDMDKLLAVTSSKVVAAAGQVFAKVPPVIEAAMALLKQLQPPAMQDPTMAAAEAAKAETARKAKADADKGAESAARQQRESQKAQLENQDAQLQRQAEAEEAENKRRQEAQLEALRQSGEDSRAELDAVTRTATNDADNQTAMDLALLEVATGEKTSLSTGTGVNPGSNP